MFKLFDFFDLDFLCRFSKLQYNSLAFVAGFKRATDEGSLPEIAQYSPYYLPLNVFYCFQRIKPLYFIHNFSTLSADIGIACTSPP